MSAVASGSIVTAQAFLAAGNFKLVETHLAPLLAANPGDLDACTVWSEMLLKQKKFKELETFSRAWLGRDGQSDTAYVNLIGAMTMRGDRKSAIAILDRYRELKPAQVEQQQALQGLIDLNCPARSVKNKASQYDAMIAEFERRGDEKNAMRYQSQAAFCRSNFADAVRLGDLSWAAGYTATSFASYMAMICFRSFRFAKSRHYARQALLAEPDHAIATEMLLLTRLVWFPPFLVGHAFLFLIAKMDCRREFGAVVAASAMIAASTSVAIVLDRFAFLTPAIFLTVLYSSYTPFIGKIATMTNRYRPRTIRLSKY